MNLKLINIIREEFQAEIPFESPKKAFSAPLRNQILNYFNNMSNNDLGELISKGRLPQYGSLGGQGYLDDINKIEFIDDLFNSAESYDLSEWLQDFIEKNNYEASDVIVDEDFLGQSNIEGDYVDRDYTLLYDYINKKYIDEFYEYIWDEIVGHFFYFNRYLEVDDNNLLNIWRAITVPFHGNDNIKTYEHLKEFEGRLGVYWSWDENGAEAYCGSYGDKTVILHGLVRIEDVDWYETMWKNLDIYHLKYEKEIQVGANAPIKLLGFSTCDYKGETKINKILRA